MTNDDSFSPDFLSNDYLAGAASRVLEIWLQEHNVEPSVLLDSKTNVELTKTWLEPLTVKIEVLSDLFAELYVEDEEPFHVQAPNFEVYCGVVPSGLQMIFQFISDNTSKEKGPAAVTAMFPHEFFAEREEAKEFLKEMWGTWLIDTNRDIGYTIFNPQTAWESNSSLGDTAFEWLQSLGDSTIVFSAPLKTNEECTEFMEYASGYIADNMVVSSLTNPFLTRTPDEGVSENVFTLSVGILD